MTRPGRGARAAAIAIALTALLGARAWAAPSVWAIDDGEKIARDAIATRFARGIDNPVFAPGGPIRLFALRNETVAVQIVVAADSAPLDGVTVELAELRGPGGAVVRNAPGAIDPTRFVGRPIERFVEHYFFVARASGGPTPGESLGWRAGSGPAAGAFTGWLPDALIPVEVAPPWDPYPLRIAPKQNGVVWIDVTVPRDQPPGEYRGEVVVRAAGRTLATLPVELRVVDAILPDRPLRTMLYYDRSELARRLGDGDAVERQLWQLLHRHRLTAMHDARTVADVARQAAALDGTLYTRAQGYEGPGIGLGDGVLSLGAYGSFGAPDESKLQTVSQIADAIAARGLFSTTDVFLYAADENCDSRGGAAWSGRLAGASDPNARRVRVGWTCDRNPASQPVDIPIESGAAFDRERARAAGALGKEVWVYNGSRPETGAFLTDLPAIAPRVQGWLQAMSGIARWFYWETTFWYDDNRGGRGAIDPFETAETFHNGAGDFCQGDGVLLYPGRQLDVGARHSLGMNGVVASIRLKNWRRGIEDAGYYALAHAAAPEAAEAIARRLIPRAFQAARRGAPPSWSERGANFFEARRALAALIPPGTDGGRGDGAPPGIASHPPRRPVAIARGWFDRPGSIAYALTQGGPMKRKKILIITALVALFSLCGFVYVRYFFVFATGTKAGTLNYFAKKGFVFKTYEGQLIQSGYRSRQPGSLQSNEFQFSVANEKVAEQLMKASGKEVELHYLDYLRPLPWRGYSKFVVDSITSVKDPPR